MSSYLSQITDLLTRIEREESDALCRSRKNVAIDRESGYLIIFE